MNRQVLVNFAQRSLPFLEMDDDIPLASTISDILIRLEEEGLIEPLR